MKMIIYALSFALALNCENSETAEVTEKVPAPQNKQHQEQQMLLGKVQKQDLMQPPHQMWFEPAYEAYTPEQEALETIKQHLDSYQIKGYFGTWCGDSRREVPKFYKLLELAGYDMSALEMYAVDRNKALPNGQEKVDDLQYVPTFIFYKDGKEVGRFVEYPQETLAKDIAKIVSGQAYQHAYE